MPLIIFQLNNSNPNADKQYNLSPSSPQEGICRPNENIRIEWGSSSFEKINDSVEKPTAGDGTYNSHAGHYESKIDIFGMTTIEDYEGNMEIISITIHLYCKCQITTLGYAKIECNFRFGNNGDWFSKKSVQSPYGWEWKSFTWSNLSVSKFELDNIQIKLRALIDASGFGGWVAVDAMYAEIEYRISYDAIVRPDENVQIEWSGSSYENINDLVEKPTAGDGTYNSHAGHDESKADIFGMTTVDNIYKILSITVNLYCSCEVYSGGYAEIRCRYRFGEGDWSTEQWVRSPFNMGWKSFSWGVADARQAELNELEIRLTARIDAVEFGGFVTVDVMYVKVHYSGHDSYPPSEEVFGSNNKYFPDSPSSRLEFFIDTTSSDEEDTEILFSITEELNDPYERYLRVYVDNQLKFEYYFDFLTGNNFSDTLIANELKTEGDHHILIEIFDGSYGSTSHYKLNYLKLSSLEFEDLDFGPVEKYAVIVGISVYIGGDDLSYCDDDANDWYNHLTGTEMDFDDVWVYGDEYSNYSQWDGKATEYNVKQALTNMVNSADGNDIIVFTTSGHGGGNGLGSSFLDMSDSFTSGENGEDGKLYDTELRAILDDAVANRIFVFIDHCFAGGFGPDLVNMPNGADVYCTTTCTENGYGYDEPDYENGAWTYFFLEYSWINHYGGSATVAMENVFIYAHNNYPYGGGDEPQEYDGATPLFFYLN